MDQIHDRGFLELEGRRIQASYSFRILREFLGQSEVPGLFDVRDGSIVLDEPDGMRLFAASANKESCTLVLASGLSLEIFIVGGDPMEGTAWSIIIKGDSIAKLLKERGLE